MLIVAGVDQVFPRNSGRYVSHEPDINLARRVQRDPGSEDVRGPAQSVVIAAAKRAGWLVYHTHDSRRSQAGYPDLALVHEQRGVAMFRELKTEKGKLRPDQVLWLRALTAAGQDAKVWRPIDWFSSRIDGELGIGDRSSQ